MQQGWPRTGRLRGYLAAGLAVLGLLVSGQRAVRVTLAQRAAADTVLVADQNAFAALAQGQRVPPATMFRALRQAGIGAVGVSEDTLASLQSLGLVTVTNGSAWLDRIRAGGLSAPPFKLVAADSYVLVPKAAMAHWLRQALPRALGPRIPVRWQAEASGTQVAVLSASLALVTGTPVGFPPGSFALARQAHLAVVPRPANTFTGLSAAALAALLQRIATARAPVAAVLFAGSAQAPLPGGAAGPEVSARFLAAHDWTLAVVDQPGVGNLLPPGMGLLAARLPGDLARVYSIPALASYNSTETARLAQFISAADARIVYIHPVLGGRHPGAESLAYVASLASALRARGLRPASAPARFPALHVGFGQRLVEAVGAAAGLLWLVWLVLPAMGDRRGALVAALTLVVAVALALAPTRGAATVLAAVGALDAIGLGVFIVVRSLRGGLGVSLGSTAWGALWRRAVMLSAAWAGLAIVGGLFAGSWFADGQGLVGWPGFPAAGFVSAFSLLLVMGLFAAVVGPGPGGWAGVLDHLTGWAERPIIVRIWHIAVVAAALVVAYGLRHKALDVWVYDLRSPWRVITTTLFTAPPSERVVLVAFPALFLAVWCTVRGWRWWSVVALLVATLGQGPLVGGLDQVSSPMLAQGAGEAAAFLLGLVAGTAVLGVLWMGDSVHRRVTARHDGPAAIGRGGGAHAKPLAARG